jgi:effector-binding domain-containing protein
LKNQWLPQSGHRMGHPSYEIYINNPMTAKPSELLTEIYVRLE